MADRLEPISPVIGHTLVGRADLVRVARRRFPANQLIGGQEVVAELGKLGWLRIYLGRGVRVELADGTAWRIRAATIGGAVCPVVVDRDRRKVALGRGGRGTYGISGGDFGYSLNPGHRPRRRDARWTLRHHERNVAVVTRRPLSFESVEPVHLGAVLLSVVLIKYGVPDDARPGLPQFRWR